MKLVLAGAASLALLAACASAPRTDADAEVAAADTKICQKVQVLGQRTPQKVCRTQAQWDAAAKQ